MRFIADLTVQDLDNAIEFLEKINNIWACVLEIAIGTWLLERQIGATCVTPLLVTLGKNVSARHYLQLTLAQCVLLGKDRLPRPSENLNSNGMKQFNNECRTPLQCSVRSRKSKSQGLELRLQAIYRNNGNKS